VTERAQRTITVRNIYDITLAEVEPGTITFNFANDGTTLSVTVYPQSLCGIGARNQILDGVRKLRDRIDELIAQWDETRAREVTQ
jgi:hypothetical protein